MIYHLSLNFYFLFEDFSVEKEILEPLCRKRVLDFFYGMLYSMGKDPTNYYLTDADFIAIKREFNKELGEYSKTERELMEKEFIELLSIYKMKRDEINSTYA